MSNKHPLDDVPDHALHVPLEFLWARQTADEQEGHFTSHQNNLGFNANDAGFAGQISSRYWPELAHIGPQQLGTVLTHQGNHRTFYALVCHSLERGGWYTAPQNITTCLESLDLPHDFYLASVAIGYGPVGRMGGADTFAILNALARAPYRFTIFTRD